MSEFLNSKNKQQKQHEYEQYEFDESSLQLPSSIKFDSNYYNQLKSIKLDSILDDTLYSSNSNCNSKVQNEHESFLNDLNNLRNDLHKFQADLLLSELKIELNYLVDKVKNQLYQEFKSKFDQHTYEISILNAKLSSLDFKLVIKFILFISN